MADDTKPENANPASIPDIPKGPRSWGTSFERLLDDPAGLHAFSVSTQIENLFFVILYCYFYYALGIP